MNYDNRLPVIGGLLEITKSKKGVAFIIALSVLSVGSVLNWSPDAMLFIASSAISYIGGVSWVDARNAAGKLQDAVDDVLEDVTPQNEINIDNAA